MVKSHTLLDVKLGLVYLACTLFGSTEQHENVVGNMKMLHQLMTHFHVKSRRTYSSKTQLTHNKSGTEC